MSSKIVLLNNQQGGELIIHSHTVNAVERVMSKGSSSASTIVYLNHSTHYVQQEFREVLKLIGWDWPLPMDEEVSIP